MEKKYSLVEFSKEESDALSKELNEVLAKHAAHLEPVPKVLRSNVGFALGADMVAMKKVEAVEPIKSPFMTNGTENPGEAQAA